jgi:3D (Asp-Asp-Asp) domain-containing protein
MRAMQPPAPLLAATVFALAVPGITFAKPAQVCPVWSPAVSDVLRVAEPPLAAIILSNPKPPVPAPVITEDGMIEHSIVVTAFAYNADDDQTDDSEDIAAWGDKLSKHVQSIAVSNDLLEMGLTRGARVQIRGRKGDYVVLDKMNPRWKKSIDIFMTDDDAAYAWGRRKVRITWKTKAPPELLAGDAQTAPPTATSRRALAPAR